jgi:hypothetical protein
MNINYKNIFKKFFKDEEITAYIELPFWIRIPGDFCLKYDDGHELIVRNNFYKLWINEIRFDYETLLYMGTKEVFYENTQDSSIEKIKDRIIKKEIPALWQRCRTVIEIKWRDKNFAKALKNKSEFRIKNFIFQILIPHINEFIEQYRMLTFDQMVYKINPWDIPMVFFKVNNELAYGISTFDYLSWNEIPLIARYDKPNTLEPFYLISEPEKVWKNYESFQRRYSYEIELLDAYNFKIRGDYESAIRRAVTAFEILLDKKIKDALIKKGKTEQESEKEIEQNYEWQKKKKLFYEATGKKLDDILSKDLLTIIEEARRLRHEIVHKGRKITPSERGRVRFFIDHLRFAINSLEEDQRYSSDRDNLLIKSNLEFVDFLDL